MKLLILEIDALAYDYIQHKKMPFLFKLAQNGLFNKMEPDTLHTMGGTQFSGCYPQKHRIIANYLLNETNTFKNKLHLIDNFLSLFEKMLPGSVKNYYRHMLRTFRKTTPPHFHPWNSSFHSPASPNIADWNYNIPTCLNIFNQNNINFFFPLSTTKQKTFRQSLLLKLRKFPFDLIEDVIASREYDIIWSPTGSELDRLSHKLGPFNKKVDSLLKKIDRSIEKIVQVADRTWKEYSIIIYSDHGMVPCDQYFNATKLLSHTGHKQPSDYITFLDSDMVRIWTAKKEVEQELTELFSKQSEGFLLNDEICLKHHLPRDWRRWGNIIFILHPGYIVSPNYWQGTIQYRGMHGYLEPHPNKYATFIAHGNRFQKGTGYCFLVDIVPTVLELLKINVPNSFDGTSLVNHT